MSRVAAVRGAVQVAENSAEAILDGTTRLLVALIDANAVLPARIVSALFTTTEDLDADFPAHAARRLGWTEVPMLNAREIPVPGALPRVIRVLLTLRDVPADKRLQPVYLDGAAALRPDLVAAARPAAAAAGKPAARHEWAAGARRRTVAIIGVGQIGGAIGLSLAGRGWHRVGFDADPDTLVRALAAGALDEATATLEAACARAALAVLATPVDTLPELIARAAAALPPGAALLDTGSARGPLTPALDAAAARVRAVGGHPLAGSAGHGFAAARAGLFAGAPFTLLPPAGDVPDIIHALLADLGARPVIVDPERHDAALARTSHLPYLVARALAEQGAEAAAAGLAGPAFRDMTRVAASDPRMAEAYVRANAREVIAAWRALREDLDARVRALQPPDV